MGYGDRGIRDRDMGTVYWDMGIIGVGGEITYSFFSQSHSFPFEYKEYRHLENGFRCASAGFH